MGSESLVRWEVLRKKRIILDRLGLDLALRFAEFFETELVMVGIQGVLLSGIDLAVIRWESENQDGSFRNWRR